MCEVFGILPTGETIYKVTLKSDVATANIISYGATLISFRPFGREIVGGFDTLSDYTSHTSYYGATVGRVCNRIADACFTMDGKSYALPKNNGENCLHGGIDALHNNPWQLLLANDDEAVFSYLSPDGQSGFPGNLSITAAYKLQGSSLYIEYKAVSDKKTPVMITNHAFFNLDSYEGTVGEHRVQIFADRYTEINDKKIPTGIRPSVVGTPYDFLTPHTIGERIDLAPLGYDHNFILLGEGGFELFGASLSKAAIVEGKRIRLTAYTDQPGVQFYVQKTKNPSLPDIRGGIPEISPSAFCLETQIEPDCVNSGRGFVEAGEEYISRTVYSAELIDG